MLNVEGLVVEEIEWVRAVPLVDARVVVRVVLSKVWAALIDPIVEVASDTNSTDEFVVGRSKLYESVTIVS